MEASGGHLPEPMGVQPHNSTMFSPGLSIHNRSAVSNANTTTVAKRLNTTLPANVSRFMNMSKEAGVKEMITSLAVLCMGRRKKGKRDCSQ